MIGKIKLFFREPSIDTNRPIVSGSVSVDGFETHLVDQLEDADAWDAAFAGRMLNFDEQSHLVSIPAFPNRKFRLSYIYVNASAGIQSPRDLHGRRVAVRYWSNTAGVWARGALQHHFGVDLTRIQWIAVKRDQTRIPDGALNIEYLDDASPSSAIDSVLDELLVSGAVDAVIDANVLPSITRKDPRTRRLFTEYVTEEQNYFKATGIFPISHIVTFRKAFVQQHPDAPVALLHAFRRARDHAIDAIEGSDPQILVLSWVSHHLEQQRAIMGEHYFSYEVERNETSLDAMLRFAHEQWLTPRLVARDNLFDPTVAALPDAGPRT